MPVTLSRMSTMNISLPAELKDFVDQQVGSRGYTSSSEYVRELIRKERDREHLRKLMLEGLSGPIVGVADKTYFDDLRQRIRDHATKSDRSTAPAGSGVTRNKT